MRKWRSKAPPLARTVPRFARRTRSASDRTARTSSVPYGEVVRNVEQGAHLIQEFRGSALRRQRDEQPVVDELHFRRQGGAIAVRVERSQHGGDRACRRCCASTLGTIGEDLSVALVEARDGITEVILRETARSAGVARACRARAAEMSSRSYGPTSKVLPDAPLDDVDRRNSARVSPSVAKGSCAIARFWLLNSACKRASAAARSYVRPVT